jgi:hypothetical protein
MGFTFDDSDSKGIATPLQWMRDLIQKDPHNAERIFPYIGGEEVNDSPTHEHHRYVINFADFPLRRESSPEAWQSADHKLRLEWIRSGIVPLDYPGPVAADWPDLLDVVERKVRPDRETDNREVYRRFWWQFAEKRPGLTRALSKVSRSLVVCRHSPHLTFARLSPHVIGADSLNFIALDAWADFAVLQSRVHEVWARLQGSSIKDDLRYTTTECFDTFPFPAGQEARVVLDKVGQHYFERRAEIMRLRTEGLTALYNRFHDPGDLSDDIAELRGLHDRMDRAVLDAYGWTSIRARCEFVSEFNDEDEEDDSRKQRYRYRWPEEVRDEVLALLLSLNQQRYEEETLAGLHDRPADSVRSKRESFFDSEDLDKDQGELEL